MCRCDNNGCNCGSNLSGLAFFAGIALGAIAGAAAGLLLTPADGESNRAKFKKFSEDAFQKSKVKFNELNKSTIKPAVKKISEDVKTKVEELSQKAKQRFNS